MELKEKKLNEIRNSLDALVMDLEEKSHKGVRVTEVARDLFGHLLSLGLQLLSYWKMPINSATLLS